MRAELDRRAAYACVDDVAGFRHAVRAVTRAGQLKDHDRHEKDDRYRVDDRTRYVLGWSNQNKIDALLDEEGRLARRIDTLVTSMAEHQEYKNTADQRLHALSGLAEYRDPADLDWPAAVRDIAERRRDLSAIRGRARVPRIAGRGRKPAECPAQ